MRRDKGISVNDRGRVVIDDIPDDERRRSSSKKKSDAKKKMQAFEEESKVALAKKSKKTKGYEKDEPEPKKKKKRKKKTAGELIESGKTDKVMKRLSKFESKALSVIQKIQGDAYDQSDLLPAIVVTSESEFLDEYGRIYTNLQTIIRKIEKSMLDPEKAFVSSKDVYALSTLYSQIRETIADMRSIKDMQAQADSLALHILEPLKSSTGEVIIGLYYKIMQNIRHYVSDERVIESLKNSVDLAASEAGNTLKNDFTVARAKIIDVLNGNR